MSFGRAFNEVTSYGPRTSYAQNIGLMDIVRHEWTSSDVYRMDTEVNYQQ